MLLYTIIMFAASIVLIVLGCMIYQGKTELIHSYHQKNVKDKQAYGRAFGKAMLAVAAAPLASGIIGAFAHARLLELAAVLVLLAGMVLGFCCILSVQRKYNGGLF